MRWRSSYVAIPAVIALASWLGCATAGVADGIDDDAGGGGTDEAGDPGTSDAGSDTSSPGVDADQGGGFDAAIGDTAPPPSEASTSCVAPNTCQGATDIGSVSGDTSSQPVNESGFTSTWMQIKVTEDDTNPLGKKLNFHATLTSPASTNFDLYVYLDDGSSSSPTTRACGAPSAQSTNATGPDTASLTWGEGTPANGSDDTRIVSIEVRYVGGTCDPSAKWSLVVTGN